MPKRRASPHFRFWSGELDHHATAPDPQPKHLCHAIGCARAVPPKMLMCLPHWRMVPRELQQEVWRTYRPGQEIDKRPSVEYIAVQRRAVAAVTRARLEEDLRRAGKLRE
jgi:hypothetical protein